MKKSILFFLLVFSNVVFACDCAPLKGVSKESTGEYDVVFYGVIDSVSACKGTSVAYFSINELYKGTLEKQVKIKFDCASSCQMSLAKGEEWLIYAIYEKFDVLKIDFCGHSRKRITDDLQDIYMMAERNTFEKEKELLTTMLGLHHFISGNDLNKQHNEMGPRNAQPSGWGKLVLLLVSLSVMGGVYYFTRKKKK
ncbi:MAG TPA: hypothetical protein VGC65_02685 [Bacteroidia bacterium]|jgi:hypothetical protein